MSSPKAGSLPNGVLICRYSRMGCVIQLGQEFSTFFEECTPSGGYPLPDVDWKVPLSAEHGAAGWEVSGYFPKYPQGMHTLG